MKLLIFISLLICLITLCKSQFVTKTITKSPSEIKRYWTPERMQAAKPMDLIKVDFIERSPLHFIPLNKTEEVPIKDYNRMPYRAQGRFFFTVDGDLYSCSSQSVGTNISINAGHCLSDGRGAFYDDMLFCPQYHQGKCPKGKFAGIKAVVTKEWHNGGDLARDFGFVRYSKNEKDETLGKAVGKFFIVANLARNQKCIAVGYPGNHGKGELMIRSFGQQSDGHHEFKPITVRFPSTMTYGSSGGGWSIDSTKHNRINGIVSYGNPSRDPHHFYGPYFDHRVIELKKEIEK